MEGVSVPDVLGDLRELASWKTVSKRAPFFPMPYQKGLCETHQRNTLPWLLQL